MTPAGTIIQPPPPRLPLHSIPWKPTDEKPPPDTQEQGYRFRYYPQLRNQLRTAVWASNLPGNQKIRFLACGSNAWIERSPSTGRYRCVCNTCKLRFCPACRHQAMRHVADWIRQALTADKNRTWRFVTLTSRHTRAPLSSQTAAIKKAFRRLRQRRFWRERVAGGFAVLEIKLSENDSCWHPHLHILCHGHYLEQRKLSKEWLQATRTSTIVDVRAVKNAEYAARYIAKYVTKPPPAAVLANTERFNEWMDGTRFVRLVTTFGKIQPYQDQREKDDYPKDWQPDRSLARCIAEASSGDPIARAILNALYERPDDEFPRELFSDPQGDLPTVRRPP